MYRGKAVSSLGKLSPPRVMQFIKYHSRAMDMATAGPSKPPQKVKGAQASTSAYKSNIKRVAPPLPARPTSSSHPSTRKNGTHATLPLKNIQGTKTRRTDSSKDGWDRDVVFVTRNAPLGALIGRCRSLVMVEGYVLQILDGG